VGDDCSKWQRTIELPVLGQPANLTEGDSTLVMTIEYLVVQL